MSVTNNISNIGVLIRASPGQDVEDEGDCEVGGGHVDPDAHRERRQEREQVRVLGGRFLEGESHIRSQVTKQKHCM